MSTGASSGTLAFPVCSAQRTTAGVRQVTDLDGARIFRVVQQPDGAAVFPLEIPDAAAHESAQHLPGRTAAPRPGPEQ